MIDDPIVKEVRKSRREIFESYGSLRAYHNAILEKQMKYGSRLVTLSPKKIDPNRVAGGFSPPAPTPPGMRVRTGRFTKITGP
jgi:hypothetical protein